MKTIKINVSINPVSSRDTTGGSTDVRVNLVSPDNGNPRTKNELVDAAIERACHKLFGANTFWWADSGLRGYGQVMRPCKSGGSDAVTYRAGIDVSVPDLPASHTEALNAYHEKMREIYAQAARNYQTGLDAGRNGEPPPKCDDLYGDVDRGWAHGKSDYQDSLTREF